MKTAVENFANHRKELEKELQLFVKGYTGKDTTGIIALSDKINIICNHRGSPSSVYPMLASIINGRVKKWSNKYENNGKQLGLATQQEIGSEQLQHDRGIIVGHFRTEGKGYILNEEQINYIKIFYFKNAPITKTKQNISEYDKQAISFLRKSETTFSIMFNRKGNYFDTDEQERNIYTVTLQNKIAVYSFTFGSSINDTKNNIIPSEYDVLACLTKYDPGTFADFCSEYGYDEDSRKAEKTYKSVKDEWLNVCALFSDEELSELQEIQ